ncbi:Ros/MucR family transcriptional regulator, partial [Inquilinus limosus]|uniref:MucR family transcriptional regulator n=1 Tax=Inquilinus limosus TaxID=171674 RepID=UPI00068D576E
MARPSETEILRFTKEIVVAHVSRNTLDSESLLDLIRNVYTTLSATQGPLPEGEADPAEAHDGVPAEIGQDGQEAPAAPLVPAVPVEESVTADYIVCLEDGRRFKTMKRWLRATYGLSPEQYRERWGLPADYPLTAAQLHQGEIRRRQAAGSRIRPPGPGGPRQPARPPACHAAEREDD